jgi:hypothetical protein
MTMQITFSPVRDDRALTLARKGDALIINGEAFDFARLPEGAVLPASAIASAWFTGSVRRAKGEIQMSLILPHGARAPQERLFPKPLRVTTDGAIDLPLQDGPEARE